jgi:hypothetical protein
LKSYSITTPKLAALKPRNRFVDLLRRIGGKVGTTMDEAASNNNNNNKKATWLRNRILEETLLATLLGGVPSLSFYHNVSYYDMVVVKADRELIMIWVF